jgi:hypothetical protein
LGILEPWDRPEFRARQELSEIPVLRVKLAFKVRPGLLEIQELRVK